MIRSRKVKLIYQEITEYIINLLGVDKAFVFMGIKYIFEVQDEFDINEIVRLVEKQGLKEAELIMTMADKLRQEGRQQGRLEGIRDELIDTVAILLSKKLKLSNGNLDGRLKELDIEKLRKIRDNIFEISLLEDLDKYIN